MEEWEAQLLNENYKPKSFSIDGFVHYTSIGDLKKVYLERYSNQAAIVLISVDVMKIATGQENSEELLSQQYPHLTAALNKSAIVHLETIGSENDLNNLSLEKK